MIRASMFVAEPNPPVAKCWGKVCFESPQRAYGVMFDRRRSRGIRQVYRCSVCGLWHIGWRI